jgi:hypothetical protein
VARYINNTAVSCCGFYLIRCRRVNSLFLQIISFGLYMYGSSCNGGCLEDTTKYLAITLFITSGTSVAAVVVSLGTYALDHQFYTGGAYFVEVRVLAKMPQLLNANNGGSTYMVLNTQGWFVYSAFVYGCEGPQYLPGPGIVMQSIGAVSIVPPAVVCPSLTYPPFPRQPTAKHGIARADVALPVHGTSDPQRGAGLPRCGRGHTAPGRRNCVRCTLSPPCGGISGRIVQLAQELHCGQCGTTYGPVAVWYFALLARAG